MTVAEMHRVTLETARGSARAATRAWSLLDEREETVGFVVEQAGSLFSMLRRHMSTTRYRYDTTFHVTDPGGAVELVVAREPANRLRTQVDVNVTLADGTAVARVEQRSGGTSAAFEITDANRTVVATVEGDGMHWTVTAPDGTPLGAIERLPVTRSVVHPNGRTAERYVLDHAPDASARVRLAVLALGVGQASSRPG